MFESGAIDIDSLSCEVAQHRLEMLAEEGGVRASRSAGSPFVQGRGSCASAIFTREGELVAQTLAGMLHVCAVGCMMMAVLKRFPASEMREGDVFLCNDPFQGGIHPTDLACFRPIFHDGEVAFFTGMLMVVADMGGMSSGGLPATATEVFHEGVVLPPTRLVAAGTLNEAVIDIMLSNSRLPSRLRTDVEAMIGATAIVSRRLEEMIGRYSLETLNHIIVRLCEHSEAMVRAGMAAIPDGEYFGSYCAEEDGVGPAPSYAVKVRIKVDGTGCLFDFSGTAGQAPGAINSSYSQSLSFVTFALRCYLDPNIAMNQGLYRPFRVEFPVGSVVNPLPPAACNLRFSVGQAMVDAIHAAFRTVFPDRAVAPSSALVSVNAHSTLTAKLPWALMDVQFGPGGGRNGADANDGLAFPMIGGGGYYTGVEAYESIFPVLYERVGFVPDTCGPGKWRGGAGVSKDIRLWEDCVLTLRATDRVKCHPAGIEGGGEGRGGGFSLNPGTREEKCLPTKATNINARAGDILRTSVAGGGGYGNPLERDPEQVARDVRAKLISIEGALADYGVVVSDDGMVCQSGTIDARQRRGARK
jgi:N-methylhydantoinase B